MSERPKVTSWLSRMPDSISSWALVALLGLVVEVAVLHVQLDDVREDLALVKGALGIGVRQPAARPNDEGEGARTAALGR